MAPPVSPNLHCRVRIVAPNEISPGLRAAWSDLEARAIEPNAYLSPHFVLPAIRRLDPGARIIIVLVETGAAGSNDLVGVGVFRAVSGSRRFPVPHLQAYRSEHSFLSGLLLDRECAQAALDSIFDTLRALRWHWHGVEFTGTWADGAQSDLLKGAIGERGLSNYESEQQLRAILTADHRSEQLPAKIKAREKQVRRHLRKLEELGRTTWAIQRNGPIDSTGVESFLELEHCGWKGEAGTSLRSNPADEAFFREVVEGFGSVGRALFTELKLDDKVISSTSNFISGKAGFAFKVGWKIELAKMSPGSLNELELMQSFQQGACSDLDFFDSGAAEGSYLDQLWTGRRPLISTVIASSPVGRSALNAVSAARHVKHHVRHWLKPTPSDTAEYSR